MQDAGDARAAPPAAPTIDFHPLAVAVQLAATPTALTEFFAKNTLPVIAFLVCTPCVTTALRSLINWIYGLLAVKCEFLGIDRSQAFLPNVAAFSLVCVSLAEDLCSILLVNDDHHSILWLYLAFSVFPIADAAFSEVAECWDVPFMIDDLLFGILFECLQGVLFLYFSDFTSLAWGIFGFAVIYQVIMVWRKTYTKKPTIVKGGICGFVQKYRWALGSMLAFAALQFSLDQYRVEVPKWVQVVFTIIPWAIGLSMDLDNAPPPNQC